jgi:Helix-turn-helix domain
VGPLTPGKSGDPHEDARWPGTEAERLTTSAGSQTQRAMTEPAVSRTYPALSESSPMMGSDRFRAIRAAPPLTDLLADPHRVGDLDPAQARRLLIEIATIQPLLMTRALATGGPTSSADRLLKVADAARRLGQSPDWLYRHASRMPFTVRQGRGLRFSEQRLERYIAQHANGRHGS